jgi:Trk K+ transport system NAD-binding subunit
VVRGALRESGVAEARTVVLALPDDATTEVATLVVRDLGPSTEIVARAEETENVTKIYRAGADYVLALTAVNGRMLATTILEGEEGVSLNTQIEVVRTSAPRLAGQRLEEARIRSRTGCTVVGVEHDGDTITDLGPEFRIEADDVLIVAGTGEGGEPIRRTGGVSDAPTRLVRRGGRTRAVRQCSTKPGLAARVRPPASYSVGL